MPKYGVSLLSGGLDSTTVTAHAKDKVDHISSITFHYGQTHSKEVDCAVEVARLMEVEHEIMDISFLSKVAWYSALTSPERFPMPADRPDEEIGFGVPITYVPLRNTIFLSLAAAFLESRVLHSMEVEGVDPAAVTAAVYMAPNALDYSGYPDCRPEFYEAMKSSLALGSKIWTEYQIPIEVETPIIDLSKAEIVALGMNLEVPLEYTWSCYDGKAIPCSACDSCILRARGFAEAGVPDPLLVRLGQA